MSPHPPSSTVQVPSSLPYPRPMATWDQRQHIYPCCGWLCHQIHIPWQCTTSAPCIERKNTISEDWEAKLYIGIRLKWDYSKLKLDLSMPDYVTAALQRFRHQLKNTRQSSPHHHVPPTYGARVQFAEPEEDTPLLLEERLKFIQQVVGVF